MNGCFDGNCCWIIILLIILFGCGNNGCNNNCNNGCGCGC